MGSRLVLIVVVLVGLSAWQARAETVTAGDWCACASRDEYRTLVRLASSGDRVAFGRAVGSAMMAGRCIRLEPGSSVYVAEPSALLVRIRFAGQTNEWWTSREAIQP